MVLIAEARIRWQNVLGGTGYTVMHFGAPGDQSSANAIVTAMANWAQQTDVVMPQGTTWESDNEVRVLEDTTGALQNVFTATTGQTGIGTGPQAHAAGVGASITWDTGSVVNGRRLRGRTFVVPISASAYDVSGNLTEPIITNISGPAGTLAATGLLKVWSRPFAGDPESDPPKPARPGSSAFVTSSTVRDRVSWLASRKR